MGEGNNAYTMGDGASSSGSDSYSIKVLAL